MNPILDLLKKKEKEIEYEIVKSRSGLPMYVLPIPEGINMDTEDDLNSELLKERESKV
jgi:hypothetical protein